MTEPVYWGAVSWFGKAVGGGVGFWLGGPIGAILGAMIGHQLDEYIDPEIPEPYRADETYARQQRGPRFDPRESAQAAFFVATFSLLAKMAKADGVVQRAEIEVIDRFMSQQLNLSSEVRTFAIGIFNEAKDSPHDHRHFASQFAAIFHGQTALKAQLLDILYRVAMADGDVSPEEERILRDVSEIFGFTSRQHQDFRQSRTNAGPAHYAVLGLDPSVSMDEVKKRHRELLTQYHPDKIVSQGLPEEFVQVANEKIQEINAAYDAIKRERNG